MSLYNEMFDKVEPMRSPVELMTAVTEASRPVRRHSARPLAAVAAGLAAAMTMTVTVGAVSGWDFGGLVRTWFGTEDENSVRSKYSQVKVLECSNSFENLDFDFIGAISDDIMTTLFVEITRTDGGILDTSRKPVERPDFEAEGITEEFFEHMLKEMKNPDEQRYEFLCYAHTGISELDEHGKGVAAIPLKFEDDDPTDNKLIFTVSFDTGELKESGGRDDIAVISLSGEELTHSVFKFEKLSEERSAITSGHVVETFTGMLEAELEISLNTDESITIYPDTVVEFKAAPVKNGIARAEDGVPYDLTVKRLSVSSSAFCYEAEGELLSGYSLFTSPVTLNFKDGTFLTVDFYGDRPEFATQRYVVNEDGVEKTAVKADYSFAELIDINNIESIVLENQTITF